MSEEQIQDAARVSQAGVGFSTYFHSIGYSVERFKEELADTVAYIKSQNG